MSLAQPDAAEHAPHVIGARAALLNFASIHTSVMMMAGILTDIYGSPPKDGVAQSLHEEVAQILGEEGGVWTKAGLSRMARLDSAVKETLRLRSAGATILARKVMTLGGVHFAGIYLPYGSTIGAPAWPVMRDPENWPSSDGCDPFRFSRPREEFEASRREAAAQKAVKTDAANDTEEKEALNRDDAAGILLHKNQSLLNTSETFLAWGHGKHACPDRYLASTTLRLLTAYAVLHYEVEPLPERVKNDWVRGTSRPLPRVNLRVRRRRGT